MGYGYVPLVLKTRVPTHGSARMTAVVARSRARSSSLEPESPVEH